MEEELGCEYILVAEGLTSSSLQSQQGVTRAVASLTVPGGQEFHFPQFFLKF